MREQHSTIDKMLLSEDKDMIDKIYTKDYPVGFSHRARHFEPGPRDFVHRRTSMRSAAVGKMQLSGRCEGINEAKYGLSQGERLKVWTSSVLYPFHKSSRCACADVLIVVNRRLWVNTQQVSRYLSTEIPGSGVLLACGERRLAKFSHHR